MNEKLLNAALSESKFFSGQFWLTPPGNNSWFRKTFVKPRRRN